MRRSIAFLIILAIAASSTRADDPPSGGPKAAEPPNLSAKLIFKGDGFLIHSLPTAGTIVHTTLPSGEMKMLVTDAAKTPRVERPMEDRRFGDHAKIMGVVADKERIYVLDARSLASNSGEPGAQGWMFHLIVFRSRDAKRIYSTQFGDFPRGKGDAGPLTLQSDGVTCAGTRYEFRGDEFIKASPQAK